MTYNEVLNNLSKSKFRSNFQLKKYMIDYINDKGIDEIRKHAYDFINKRLGPAVIPNDGKQTPMKGHPVFIAQHACACCCRGCLERWHKIPKNKNLTSKEIDYIVNLLMLWIKKELQEEKWNY